MNYTFERTKLLPSSEAAWLAVRTMRAQRRMRRISPFQLREQKKGGFGSPCPSITIEIEMLWVEGTDQDEGLQWGKLGRVYTKHTCKIKFRG